MKRLAGILVPCVAALAVGGCANLGLHPFPKDIEPGHGMKHGVNPFPARALNPHPTKSMGLTAFPKAKPASARSIGLDPFPLGRKGCDAGCVKSCCAPPAPAPKTVSAAPKAAAAAPVAAPAAAPVAPPAPAGTFLRLAFEPGVSRRYRMDMDTLMKTPMFGEEGMTMKMGMDMKQTVGKVKEDGSAQVLSVIESISMEMANPMTGVIKVDTKDEASMKEAESNPMLGQMVGGLKQIVGKSMDMTMKPSGECVEIKGVDELMAGLSGGMGGSGGAQMTGIPSPFPEGSVTEGQEWPFEQSQESPLGTMVTTGKMKVKSLSKDTGIAVLSIDGTVAVKPSEEEADPEDMQAQMMAMIKVKNAKMSGEMTFDSRGGFLRKSTTLMTMDMENPMMGGDMAVEAKVVMSLLE